VLLLLAAEGGMFDNFDLHEVSNTAAELLEYINQLATPVVDRIDTTQVLSDDDIADLKIFFKQFISDNDKTTKGDADAET